MAFDAEGLLMYAHGGAVGQGADSVSKMYQYSTNDADTVVEADGYFDTTDMGLGDLVFASLDLDGTPEVKVYVVAVGSGVNDGNNDVTVTPMDIGT